jgi:hypothetical protein
MPAIHTLEHVRVTNLTRLVRDCTHPRDPAQAHPGSYERKKSAPRDADTDMANRELVEALRSAWRSHGAPARAPPAADCPRDRGALNAIDPCPSRLIALRSRAIVDSELWMTLATADAEHARRRPAKVPTAVAQDAAGLRARQVCVRGGGGRRGR